MSINLSEGAAEPTGTRRVEAADTAEEHLSFAALEARIAAMPDGPASRLNHPRWIVVAGSITMAGVAAGLAPGLLIQWLEPQMWMVTLARAGLWIAILASIPFFARTLWVLWGEFSGWQAGLVEQSDHDLAAFNSLRDWLVGFPASELEDHRRFAELASSRITAKLALIVGGVERLGVLPVMVALYFLVRDAGDMSLRTLADTPVWQTLLGLGLITTYAIGVLATRMRLRLEFYALMLSNALVAKRPEGTQP